MRHRGRENPVQSQPYEAFNELMDRKQQRQGGRKQFPGCLTFIKVTTPAVPRTPLSAKFAVAEKHIALPLQRERESCLLTASKFRIQRKLPRAYPSNESAALKSTV
jgi:hypothetical protein